MSNASASRTRIWLVAALCLLIGQYSVLGFAQEDQDAPNSPNQDGQKEKNAGSDFELTKAIEELRPEAVLRVPFDEALKLPFLREPVTSTGVLTIRADGLLIRRVREPNPTTVVMHGATIVMRDASGVSRMDLSTTPEAAVAVSMLRMLVVGDVDALRSRYTIEPMDSDEEDGWQVQLTPKSEKAKKIFEKCTLEAAPDNIRQITLYESDDSVRVIKFGDAKRLDALPDDDQQLLKSLGVDVADP